MILKTRPESIVPRQFVIDSGPQMHRKKSTHPCQSKCSDFKDEQCGHCLIQQQIIEPKEIIFDAELWLYERKSAFPMVDCIAGSAAGLWKNFSYHPVCNGVVLTDKDIIVLSEDGSYTVKSKVVPILKNADEAKFYAKYLEAVSYAP